MSFDIVDLLIMPYCRVAWREGACAVGTTERRNASTQQQVTTKHIAIQA
jgi:hypothetical protein